MGFLQKISKNQNFWPLLTVAILSVLAFRSLIGTGYFNMHDDLQMMRQLEMEKCFKDLQIPCRWVPDMGFGYGFPLFSYYPPLPYLIGEVVRIFGFSFVDTIKIVFSLGIFASGVTMYFFTKEFFGKWGGVLSSAFYIWAPYHSVDIFVRGAMNESWALVFFPAILFFSYKLISGKEKKINLKLIIPLSLSWFGLLSSHNLMVMIFSPVFVFWCLILFVKFKSFTKIKDLVLAGLFAFGLAAFITLPVFLEQKLVHVDTLVVGYYEYTAHFVTYSQLLISRFWGYGPSIWGDKDGLSFQIGHLHWVLSIIVLLSCTYLLFNRKKRKKELIFPLALTVFFVLAGWFAAFMTHNKSTPIWVHFAPLKFVQFPWRFLTIVILAFSFSVGSLALILPQKIKKVTITILILSVIILNWNYFRVQNGKLGSLTDQQKFSGVAWDLQRTAGIYDYLPKSAKENPRDGQTAIADVLNNRSAHISEAREGTNWSNFRISVGKGTALVRINTYFYPNWKVFIDGREAQIEIPDYEKWGRMYIEVPQGDHQVVAHLYNTWPRTVGNTVSLVSWGALALFVLKSKKWQISTKKST